MLRKLIYTLFILTLLLGAPLVSFGQDDGMMEFEITQEMVDASPYLQSVMSRLDEVYDTSEFAKEPPYRIAFAAQGTSNAWSALMDAHAYWYVDELGEEVVSELLYGDGQANAGVQVPLVEDLLAQDPDALILVPMGAAALSAPVERAMMQGVPVVLCASAVETDNFVTEVGTNLYTVGANLAQWLVATVGADGSFIMMTGIPGVTTSVIMEEGALAYFEAQGIELLDNQPGLWSPAEGKKIMETWLAQHGDGIDGIWTGGAQMAQGIISAYEDADMAIPPIAGGEQQNGFLRSAIEHGFPFYAWMYPNAMITTCLDAAIGILQGEPTPRFIDFIDSIPEARPFTEEAAEEYYMPSWSDDVHGPILMPDEKLAELGFLVEGE